MAPTNLSDIDDLLIEILSRLPARSVVRFKCVSRNWRHIISHNRRFSLLHAQRHPSPPCSGVILSSSDHFHFCWLSPRRRFSPPPPGSSLLHHSISMILQSCNGLLLCGSNSGYVVCNPTTSQTALLLPPETFPSGEFKTVSLAFDVSRWNDYKTVYVWSNGVAVYSSTTGRIEFLIEQPIGDLNRKGIYWKGKLLWTGMKNEKSMLLDFEKAKLLAFNLPCHGSRVCYCGESCGRLFLAADTGEEVDVFELEEEGTTMRWLRRFAVDARLIARYIREIESRRSLRIDDELYHLRSFVLSVEKAIEDEDEDWFLICKVPCETPSVISYSCTRKVIRVLCEFDGFRVNKFVETLYQL